ncbi:MAG TPA: sugar phosphate nucleotidyltransferase [Gemmatimonadaceae bacterium]|nr:sugar phosphate nucleotidyltransferase [Gemmatimonadaceae bacterium]
MSRWAVILAGGVGSRFWPLSTPRRPKQLLPLITESPLLADTVARLSELVPPERTLVVTNASLAIAVRALLPQLPADNVIAEPRAAGTAPALAWAAAAIARRGRPEDVMICVHADWAIGNDAAFRATLARAAALAEREHSLVTVGIVPARPDPGFGYIEPGEPVNGAASEGARHVARFAEKPNREAAARMVASGYLWNSGIFVWRAGDFLAEVRARATEVAPSLPLAESGDIAGFFTAVTPISVDEGVLERSPRVLVIPGDFGWDDVGTWAALHRVRKRDDSGNATFGDVHAVQASNNVVHAEAGTVVLYGVSDLVVVAREGLTLVTTKERAAELKLLLDVLPASVRERS